MSTMRPMTTVLALSLTLSWPAGLWGQDPTLAAGPAQATRAAVAGPEGLHPQDPADSLYRAARERLNGGDYRAAADMFRALRERYPGSAYAAQALYYRAFALYRTGGESQLRTAREVLQDLARSYGDARFAREDAQALLARIEGALARQHADAEAAAEVAVRARAAEQRVVLEERLARVAEQRARTGVQSRGGGESGCEGEDEIRIAALNALMHMNSEQALPILERVLTNRSDDPCSVAMRRKAIFLVAQRGSEENLDLMLDVVRNDPDRDVRAQAVFWLSQVPGERTVDALEEIMLRQDDGELQKKALFALSQHRSPRASRLLRDYAMREDADTELRAQAIFWLGQRGDPETVGFLRDIYGRTSDPKIKERILFSVSQTRDRENAEWLLGVAKDVNESMEIRKKAIFWASQSGIPIEEIAGLYDGIPDREVKEQIIFALSQKRSDAAVDKLLEIARNETDTELRKKAIFWLSQSDDPRVIEFLTEIIEGR